MRLSELIEQLTDALSQSIDSEVLVVDPHNCDHYDVRGVKVGGTKVTGQQVIIEVELQ